METPFTKIAQAESITHSLSAPSKMPCYSYSIPASRCITGGKLRKVLNSICSVCYAMKGRYVFQNVLDAMEKRFIALKNPLWVKAMVYLIGKKEKSGFFRWHDSGDIQGKWHLSMIVDVARLLPNIKFWLPTREYSIISEWMNEGNTIPENLTIRFSSMMLDGIAPVSAAKRLGVTVSGASDTNYNCPSSKQEGKCLDCRACWNKDVFQVTYKKH